MTTADQHKVPMPDFTTTVDWHNSPDDALQSLAFVSNAMNAAVTLYLPWGVAIGTTISGEQFFRGSAELLRSTASDSPTDGSELMASNLLDERAERAAERQQADPSELVHQGHDTNAYLHLKDVTCAVGAGTLKQPYLRVKLTAVTAWAYGAFVETA